MHIQRPLTGITNFAALRTLRRLLVAHYPCVGLRVAQAAIELEAGHAAAALVALDAMPADRVTTYLPYWAPRAHVLGALRLSRDARVAAETAIGLTEDEAVRVFLRTFFLT